MAVKSKTTGMGVRGRLLLAFAGICLFSLLAAASGFYSLSQVSNSLKQITEQRVPEALSWLNLSRQIEGIVRAAPALLVVDTEEARVAVSDNIAAQSKQLYSLLKRSSSFEADREEKAVEQVDKLVTDLNNNLLGLDALVKQRLAIAARRNKLIRKLSQANKVAIRAVAPSARILGAQIAGWERAIASNDIQSTKTAEQLKLAGSIIALVPQQRIAVLVDAIHNNLLKITTATSVGSIDILVFPLKKTLRELSNITKNLPKRVNRRIAKQIKVFGGLTSGPASLTKARKDELVVISKAEDLIAVNARLSKFLTNKISFLVDRANKEIGQANAQAAEIKTLNQNILAAIVILSLISSILIVWLYVGRNLIARLTALSDSMLAIAGGNLRAELPALGGNDEITRMGQALTGFRDTALEVEESNLRELDGMQQRLVDAIENTSEGFAFYGPDDRLVICNSRYKELLYSGMEGAIEPGMTFESLIRFSAENGLILDAEGRIEEWLKERMIQHENPGEPKIQQRKNGQWLLATERKTSDGGTVAIFSDITEMKQREEELSSKSNALEQLSKQLAKYLSPQIYDSIFSGKQEVKLVSQRKRLTIFFSDLVGFTATTETLESEDLTRLLNQYLTEMSKIALEHGATIDKFIGDAIVIFFGDPETLGVKDDALACVKMAIAMRKRMTELENDWKESGLEEPLQCRMGINTGLCTVGNFGSDDRMDYTIIGGGVNLAARLETACVPNEILISYETYAHVKDEIMCIERDKINVKGIAKPVATYQVADLFKNIDDKQRPISEKLPHARLDVDVNLMSTKERKEATKMLLDAISRLSEKSVKKQAKKQKIDTSTKIKSR